MGTAFQMLHFAKFDLKNLNLARHIHFTANHEWLKISTNRIRIGITDYAQKALGDLVYIELPKIGDSVKAHGMQG